MFFNPAFIPVIAIVGALASFVLCVGIRFAFRAWRFSQEMSLKRELMERGFSAAEIVAVINAPGTGEGEVLSPADVPVAKPTTCQQL
jgi:hypothetical protein